MDDAERREWAQEHLFYEADTIKSWSAEQRRLAALVGAEIDFISEKAWLGATGWLNAGGPDTLAFDGSLDDARGEWDEALADAARDEVAQAGVDLDAPGVDQVIWEAAYDAGTEHRSCGREPLTPESSFSELAVRWKQMFPGARSLADHLAGLKSSYDDLQAEGRMGMAWEKPDPYCELKSELWAAIFDYGFRWASDEWSAVSSDVACAMFECLDADQMCDLVRCLRAEDFAGATRLLDVVSNHEKKNGAPYFNRLTLRREFSGELRIHIAQLPNSADAMCLRQQGVSTMLIRRRFGTRQRSSRGKASPTRGSRRTTSRSSGGGSGDPDEPEPALGRLLLGRQRRPLRALSRTAALGICLILPIGIWSAAGWGGLSHVLTLLWILITGAAQLGDAIDFFKTVWRWIRQIPSPAMPDDAQAKALKDVEHVQAQLESAEVKVERLREARRQSFERARSAGLSLAQIGNAAGLHRSRVDQVLRGE